MNKTPHELEQENIKLRQSVVNEKLKKAEELFAHRLVYTVIIFIILFIILDSFIDNANAGIQWLFIIIFFAIALVVVGKINNIYTREKDDARNNHNSEPYGR